MLIVSLLAFIVGYRLQAATFSSAFVLAHLATVRFTVNTSGGTTALFISVSILILFGLYHEQDELSLDAVRRTKNWPIEALGAHLKSFTEYSYGMQPLKWSLLVVAVIYFGAGFDKLVIGELDWVATENLNRIILVRNVLYELPFDVGSFVIDYPLAVQLGAWGTLVLELGLLVAVLLRLPLTPFVLGIFGMQTVIALTIGPFFFDVFVLFALFVAWDSVYGYVARDRRLDVVFDEQCYLCVRSLSLLKNLDDNNTISFYSETDAPEQYRTRNDVDFETSMYASHDGKTYNEYYAFRELLRQFRVFFPFVWLMGRPPVEAVGTRVYRYVAANRSRYFVCSLDSD